MANGPKPERMELQANRSTYFLSSRSALSDESKAQGYLVSLSANVRSGEKEMLLELSITAEHARRLIQELEWALEHEAKWAEGTQNWQAMLKE